MNLSAAPPPFPRLTPVEVAKAYGYLAAIERALASGPVPRPDVMMPLLLGFVATTTRLGYKRLLPVLCRRLPRRAGLQQMHTATMRALKAMDRALDQERGPRAPR